MTTFHVAVTFTDDELEEHVAEDGGNPGGDSQVVFGAGTQYRPVPGSCEDTVPVDLSPEQRDVVPPMISRLRVPRPRPRLRLAPPRPTTEAEPIAVIDSDTQTEGIHISLTDAPLCAAKCKVLCNIFTLSRVYILGSKA